MILATTGNCTLSSQILAPKRKRDIPATYKWVKMLHCSVLKVCLNRKRCVNGWLKLKPMEPSGLSPDYQSSHTRKSSRIGSTANQVDIYLFCPASQELLLFEGILLIIQEKESRFFNCRPALEITYLVFSK